MHVSDGDTHHHFVTWKAWHKLLPRNVNSAESGLLVVKGTVWMESTSPTRLLLQHVVKGPSPHSHLNEDRHFYWRFLLQLREPSARSPAQFPQIKSKWTQKHWWRRNEPHVWVCHVSDTRHFLYVAYWNQPKQNCIAFNTVLCDRGVLFKSAELTDRGGSVTHAHRHRLPVALTLLA